jgi:hypothetical protein
MPKDLESMVLEIYIMTPAMTFLDSISFIVIIIFFLFCSLNGKLSAPARDSFTTRDFIGKPESAISLHSIGVLCWFRA